MKVQFTPEITLCPGSMLLVLENRIGCLRIQAMAPETPKEQASHATLPGWQ